MSQTTVSVLQMVAIIACTSLLSAGVPSGLPMLSSAALAADAKEDAPAAAAEQPERSGLVRCANLVYGNGMTSKCFADHFLADAQKQTNIWTAQHFSSVNMEAEDLFDYPFAVMSGEGSFTLTPKQRENLRSYLYAGGFLVASPGCSSPLWQTSIENEIELTFPELKLQTLPMDHPLFHTVYDIKELKSSKKSHTPVLQALVIDGRVALVYSKDGLNDTANAGGNCCCCGGNEVKDARQLNVNLLAYALTH